tara:strand:+ start:722 stop:1702 length:981 start_codon:yes stop_codon:yes gene_type:complete
MPIISKLAILKKQIKIYLRLQINNQRFVVNKTPYFYIFTMPIFGFFFSLIAKLILLINSKYLMNILSYKIFISSIRFLTPKQRLKISKLLPKYNVYEQKIELNNSLGYKKLEDIYKELTEDGVCDLGTIFSVEDCKNFINHLNNKVCFNSQTQMQSDGIPYYFNSIDKEFNNQKNPYFCFDSNTNMTFKPLKEFLKNKELLKVIDTYLGFRSSIYFNSTWYNQITNESHYVHRLHRDYDDFKFLGITVYWNDVGELNAPLGFVKKSHLNPNIKEPITTLLGSAGTVFITDTFALHKGNPANKERYTSTIRFGQPFNSASVNSGFLS